MGMHRLASVLLTKLRDLSSAQQSKTKAVLTLNNITELVLVWVNAETKAAAGPKRATGA